MNRLRYSTVFAMTICLSVMTVQIVLAQDAGLRGRVLERHADESIGGPVPGAELLFRSEDGTIQRSSRSSANGFYEVQLPPGRYVVKATHSGYEPFLTAPGFFVVTEGYQTANIFMKPAENEIGAPPGPRRRIPQFPREVGREEDEEPQDETPWVVGEAVRPPLEVQPLEPVPGSGMSNPVVALSPKGGMVIIADGRVLAHDVPAALRRKLEQYREVGKRIDVVAFAPGGRWIVLAEDWRYYSDKAYFDSIGLRPKVEQYLNEGKRFDALAFNSAGDWVLVAENYRYYSHKSAFDRMGLRPAVERFLAEGRRIHAIGITPNNGWVILADGTHRWRNVSQSTVASLRELSRAGELRAISFAPEERLLGVSSGRYVGEALRPGHCASMDDFLEVSGSCSGIEESEEHGERAADQVDAPIRNAVIDLQRLRIVSSDEVSGDEAYLAVYPFRGRIGDDDRVYVFDRKRVQGILSGDNWGDEGEEYDIPTELGRVEFENLRPFEVYGVFVVAGERDGSSSEWEKAYGFGEFKDDIGIYEFLIDRFDRAVPPNAPQPEYGDLSPENVDRILRREIDGLDRQFSDYSTDLGEKIQELLDVYFSGMFKDSDEFVGHFGVFFVNMPGRDGTTHSAMSEEIWHAPGLIRVVPRGGSRSVRYLVTVEHTWQ